MKKLFFILFGLLTLSAFAQNPESEQIDARYRRNGGMGLSPLYFRQVDYNKLYASADTTYVKNRAKVQSVAGKTGVVSLLPTDVGLSNVPNVNATNPLNISWNSSYRSVSDGEKAIWNGMVTSKANLGGNNTFGGRQTFAGDFDAISSPGYDFGAVDVLPNFNPASGSAPYRMFALRLMPSMTPPPGGLPSSTRTFSLYAKGDVLLGGNIEADSASLYNVGTSTKRLNTIYAEWVNTNSMTLNSYLTTPGLRAGYYSPLSRYEIGVLSDVGTRIGTTFNNGNHQFGSGSTDNGYKVDVQGTLRATGATTLQSGLSVTAGAASFASTGSFGGNVSITNTSGNSISINHTAGSIPVMVTHTNASVPTFGITNTAAGGWAGFRFTNDVGVGFQFNVGGSTSTICANCVNFQHVKGDAVFTIAESGKKFKIDPTNTNGSTYTFAVARATGNVEAGAVKMAGGGYSGITNGATTPVPTEGAGTMVFQQSDSHFYGWNGSAWKQLDN